jgi:hypothetical protein
VALMVLVRMPGRATWRRFSRGSKPAVTNEYIIRLHLHDRRLPVRTADVQSDPGCRSASARTSIRLRPRRKQSRGSGIHRPRITAAAPPPPGSP